MSDSKTAPQLVVFSILFPSPAQPNAGIFIRERMFRVARRLSLWVVSPQPWFPLQSLIRRWRPGFRPPAPSFEVQEGIEIYRPRFFSVPGHLKWLDGFSAALSCWWLLKRLRHRFNIIDAHFAYPDGFAATLLGRWLQVPVTITLRGTEVSLARMAWGRRSLVKAVNRANRVFAVADSLRRHLVNLGAQASHLEVVGNGVDAEKFQPVDRGEARRLFQLPDNARVLVSVGGLVERKGFHRVIEVLPALIQEHPQLYYLVVGGSGPEGDMTEQLHQQVAALGLQERVIFTGPMKPEKLKFPLSAADIFVLATRNEGWANVFLEAMACGLPVVTTEVGGNCEVVCHPGLGITIPFGDAEALTDAIDQALRKDWDAAAIRQYALDNAWDKRVDVLVDRFHQLLDSAGH